MAHERYDLSEGYRNFSSTLAADLWKARERAKLTVEEFSVKSGIGASTVRKLENGQQKVSAFVVKIYAEICNVKASDLLQICRTDGEDYSPDTVMIDTIVSDLMNLSTENLELIHIITHHLSKKG